MPVRRGFSPSRSASTENDSVVGDSIAASVVRASSALITSPNLRGWCSGLRCGCLPRDPRSLPRLLPLESAMHGVPVLDEALDSPSSESLYPPPTEPLAARADDRQRDRELHAPVFLSSQGMQQHVRRTAREPELGDGHAGTGTLVRVERVELPGRSAEAP